MAKPSASEATQRSEARGGVKGSWQGVRFVEGGKGPVKGSEGSSSKGSEGSPSMDSATVLPSMANMANSDVANSRAGGDVANSDVANMANGDGPVTYRYRDAAKRRAYQRDLMRRRRASS